MYTISRLCHIRSPVYRVEVAVSVGVSPESYIVGVGLHIPVHEYSVNRPGSVSSV